MVLKRSPLDLTCRFSPSPSFLRVLTLWFDYGHWPEVNEALVEGIKTIQIDTWLQVTHTYTTHKAFNRLLLAQMANDHELISKNLCGWREFMRSFTDFEHTFTRKL